MGCLGSKEEEPPKKVGYVVRSVGGEDDFTWRVLVAVSGIDSIVGDDIIVIVVGVVLKVCAPACAILFVSPTSSGSNGNTFTLVKH